MVLVKTSVVNDIDGQPSKADNGFPNSMIEYVRANDESKQSVSLCSHNDKTTHGDMVQKETFPSQQQGAWCNAFHGKLYNRNKEKDEILKAYHKIKEHSSSSSSLSQGATSSSITTQIEEVEPFILIRGEKGVGKSALARSIHSNVLNDGGYFVTGKFDPTSKSSEPYSAFISALTEFCHIVLTRGSDDIMKVRNEVNQNIKAEQHVLIDMIPSLKEILSPAVDTLDINDSNLCHDAANRFKHVFRMLIRAISSRDKPLVFLLDDLQWADEASVELFNFLVADSSTNDGILYIGTHRDEAGAVRDRLDLILANARDAHINSKVISLRNFNLDDINSILSEAVNLDLESTKYLTDLVYNQTTGNIFFVLEFLRCMFSDKLLSFDSVEKKWKWNTDSDFDAGRESGSLHDFLTTRLLRLPESVRSLLKHAACLGTKFDEIIMDHLFTEPVSPYLRYLADCGLIEADEINGVWKFCHDSIQEASYDMIAYEDRCSFHYRLGRKLWRTLTLDELDHFIFIVVGQLVFGTDMMSKEEERIAVAKLCHRAGERAFHLSDFHSANEYLNQAISLLGSLSWQHEYDLFLSLYNAAAEVAYCKGDFEYVHTLVEVTLKNTRQFDHTIQAHTTKLYALGGSGQLNEAIDYGLSILKSLGEQFPSRPSKFHFAMEIFKIRRKLIGKTDQDLLRLPLMQDSVVQAKMKILNSIFIYAFMARTKLAPLIGFRLLMLTLEHGQSVISSLGFIIYGMYLCGYGNDVEEGFRFGRLGLQMYEKFGINNWIGRVFAAYYGVVHGMKMPIKECIEPLKYAHLVALEKGDIEFAFLNGNLSLFLQVHTTSYLPDLDDEVQAMRKKVSIFCQDHSLEMTAPLALTIQVLTGNANSDATSGDDFINEDKFDSITTTNKETVAWMHCYRMWLCYLFGQYKRAHFHARICMSNFVVGPHIAVELPFILLFVGLVHLEHSLQSNSNRWTAVRSAKQCLKKLKRCAKHAPSNVLGKQFLLEAELAAFCKKKWLAFEKFSCAITLSKESGFLMETALSNERTAKFLMKTGEHARAEPFLCEALKLYRILGSERKVMHLKREISNNIPL